MAEKDAGADKPCPLHVSVGHVWYISWDFFSPDGKLYFSAAATDDSVRVWDTESWELLRRIVTKEQLERPALSPDGAILATPSRATRSAEIDPEKPGDNIEFWDTATGRRLRVLPGHARGVSRVAFSPDGAVLASAGFDDLVRLWDVRTGKLLHRLDGVEDCYPVLEFLRDPGGGLQLVVVGGDGSLRLWDAATGRTIRSVDAPKQERAPNKAAAVSCAGVVAIKGGDPTMYSVVSLRPGAWPEHRVDKRDPGISLYDLRRGKPLRTLENKRSISKLRFSPDGLLLAAGGTNNPILQVWEVATGRLRHTLDVGAGSSDKFSFSADGSLIVTCRSEQLALWEADSGKARWQIKVGYGAVQPSSFSPDGRKIMMPLHNGGIQVYDLTGKLRRDIRPHIGRFSELSTSPDGSIIAWWPRDCRPRLWDARTGKYLRRLEVPEAQWHPETHERVVFSPDGRLAVAPGSRGGRRNCLYLWKVASGRLHRFITFNDEADCAWLAFTPDGKTIAIATTRGLKLFRAADGEPIGANGVELRGPMIHGFNLSPDGSLAAITARNYDAESRVSLWSIPEGKLLRRLLVPAEPWDEPGPTGIAIFATAFSSDGKTFATGDSNGLIRLWEVASGKLLTQWQLESVMETVGFSPDGKLLVTTDEEGRGVLWDIKSRRPVHTFTAGAAPYCLPGNGAAAFSKDGGRLMGFSGARVWVRRIEDWKLLDPNDPKTAAGLPFRQVYPRDEGEGFAFFDLLSGQPLVHTMLLNESDKQPDEWIGFTDDGHYVGSEGVECWLRLRVGGRLVPMTRERAKRWRRPDLVERALGKRAAK